MVRFEHVLCPIDFSDTSARALDYAAALAGWYEATLEVLHVVPAFEGAVAALGQLAPVPQVAAPREDVESRVQHAIEATGPGAARCRPLVQEGRPHETILERAAAGPADLIVMGTHGRGGVSRLLLGSTTERVVRTARCPVLTIPAAAPAAPAAPAAAVPAPIAFKRILCAVDFSPASLLALRYALELGRQADGRVTVLHALEYMDSEEPCEHVDAGVRSARSQVIEHARQKLHDQLAPEPTTWCEIEEVVAVNRAAREILARSASDCDLIVMGAQGRSGVELMLYGSNVQEVVRHATCPVLTVRG